MESLNDKKITFVIPWYGKDLTGGAEKLCRRTAENLQNEGIGVEVFATCSNEFLSDWTNFYSEGVYDENGVTVHRFPVNKRDVSLFDSINHKLMKSVKITVDEENNFIKNSINSSKMLQKIKEEDQRIFIFIPYLYGTTFYGCQIHPYRSLMIPCLHDESYAYMKIFKEVFPKIKGMIFNSNPEKKLAEKIYHHLPTNMLAGAGVDSNFAANPKNFKKKFNLDTFIIYAGRKDPAKNVHTLIDYYSKYIEKNGPKFDLVLTGPGTIEIPQKLKDHIKSIILSKEELYDAYSAAMLTCQPSLNESFSLSIMESWLNSTPVLVHENCEVTKDHCIQSNGGLYFSNFEEFESCVDYFLQNAHERNMMAKNGKEYVLKNFSWETIIKKYLNFLQELNY